MLSAENIRRFRIHSHHLDQWAEPTALVTLAGTSGLQNTPPGAWETALYNRLEGVTRAELASELTQTKTLVQAWSFRGAPVIFPVSESSAFLTALVPQGEEPWVYTRGISAALETLALPFATALALLQQVLPKLDDVVIEGKAALDETLAGWMRPLLAPAQQRLWVSASPYDVTGKQTLGAAVVSFLLRPAALLGLVVFGARHDNQPTFTSYRRWLGHPLAPDAATPAKLVRKFLHAYGPSTPALFASWLGCSGQQARRLWAVIPDEVVPVTLPEGKQAFILAADFDALTKPAAPERGLVLLGGHDPFLDQRDRQYLVPDPQHRRQVWQTVANPGVILVHGQAVGTWTPRVKATQLTVKCALWGGETPTKQALTAELERYAAFRQVQLAGVTVES